MDKWKIPPRVFAGIAKAELTARFQALQSTSKSVFPNSKRENEFQVVLRDLEVYQIELESQNRELLESREALEASHERYVNLYDFAPIGYVTLNEQGLIKEINLMAAGMLRTDRQVLLGSALAPWISKKELGIFLALLAKCTRSREKVVSMLHFVTPDHRAVPVELSGTSAIDPISGETLIRIAINDLTDRRRIEEERDRFFELSSDLLCVIGPEGYFKRLNRAWERVLGYSVEELVARPFLEFVHPEDREKTRSEMGKFKRGIKEIPIFQNRYVRKDGTPIWLTWSGVACGDMVYNVGRDISREMAAKKSLESQFAWLNELVHSLPIPLVLADAKTGNTFTRSAELSKLLDGCSPALLDDPTQTDFFFTDPAGNRLDRRDWPRFKAIRGETMEGAELTWHTPRRITHLLVWTRIIPAKHDHPPLVLVMLQNINSLKQKESSLQEAIDSLQREHQLREDFVSGLSHDLRTPLASAKISVQLFERNVDDPEKRERYVGRALRGIDRIDFMIRDLLDANRIHAGETLPMEMNRFDLSRLAETTIEDLSIIHGPRFQVETTGRVVGAWNKPQLRRVIENLVCNAVKYGDPRRIITISVAESADREVALAVHNFGNPIPKEEQPSLFDRYRRAASAEKSGNRGWGVGLTLVRGIAKAHRGRISVKSCPELGTTFTLTLPAD
jgi:PAS domain S-box-containing protein